MLAGCAAAPPKTESLDYRARVERQSLGDVSVSAVVLSPRESEHVFHGPLASEGIQPIWLELENRGNNELYLMLLSLDPNYFSPSEVAWSLPSNASEALEDRIDYFFDKHIPVVIPAHSTVSGMCLSKK